MFPEARPPLQLSEVVAADYQEQVSSTMTEEEENYEDDFEDDHLMIRLPEGESALCSDFEREMTCEDEWTAEEKEKPKE